MSRQGSDETTDLVRSPMVPVAVSLCALSVAMVVLSLVSDGNAFSDSWWLVAFVTWLLLWGVLRSMTRGVAERPLKGLDERERGLRDRVSFIGYQCAVGSGMVTVLLMVVFQNEPGMIERMPALLTTLMLTSSALPSIILGLSGAGVGDTGADQDE
ncbi:hypothetical protein [Streptomyces pacificus]|uniref:Uncharacterized protein n=1 Tax=Streptomyces pacificus TaxID=2705029 RepID=A0A6A0B2J0_9ACTN|nr:hypothetical protein [Streptomyces pacificus]GFH39530.1 hypothetical protein SCWH03_57980 [Streptomyces pacificus]